LADELRVKWNHKCMNNGGVKGYETYEMKSPR
jgi:hypothetical protein